MGGEQGQALGCQASELGLCPGGDRDHRWVVNILALQRSLWVPCGGTEGPAGLRGGPQEQLGDGVPAPLWDPAP